MLQRCFDVKIQREMLQTFHWHEGYEIIAEFLFWIALFPKVSNVTNNWFSSKLQDKDEWVELSLFYPLYKSSDKTNPRIYLGTTWRGPTPGWEPLVHLKQL